VLNGRLVKLPAGVVPNVDSTINDRLEREPCAKAILISPVGSYL
jgi:hypothetical protein